MCKFSITSTLLLFLTHNHTVDVNGANWGYKTAWLFFGTGIVVCIIVWFFCPEPSLRSPGEMDEMYDKGVPAWKMHKYHTNVQRVAERRLGVGV